MNKLTYLVTALTLTCIRVGLVAGPLLLLMHQTTVAQPTLATDTTHAEGGHVQAR
ncbi:hypothetical protein [Spirosoma arcticum]